MNSKIKSIAHVNRHVRIVLRYLSLRKIWNLFLLVVFYFIGKAKIPTMPAFLKIEVSRKCEMNCLYCAPKKEDRIYSFCDYKKLIDYFHLWIFEVSLYDIGEPLWCDNLSDYIKYAHKKKVGTSISTSLSLVKDDSFWDKLVLSGLDYLIVCIDGVTQEVYSKYRRNGNLELVMSNLKKIIKAREKYNNNLFIEWQMIDFEWNKHEQLQAKIIAKDMGIDCFRIIKEATKPREAAQKNSKCFRRRDCLLPYLIFIVNIYGEVNSCFKYYNEYMKIGDLNKQTFSEIWNGKKISQIRSHKSIRNRDICNKCTEQSFF